MITAEITILIKIIIIDYATGVMAAILEKEVRSSIGMKGIFKKFGVILCVILCTYLDSSSILQNTAKITPVIITFFIFNEGISITENLKRLGLNLPEDLIKFFPKK